MSSFSPARSPGLALAPLALLITLLASFPCRAADGFDSSRFEPFYFVQATDPHLVPDDPSLDRFRAVGLQTAPLLPPFTLVSGDLTMNTGQWSLYDFCKPAFSGFVMPIPGNHDIFSTATLAAWRTHFGGDYYSFVYNNCAFLCLNTITLIDKTAYPAEYQQQWAWLEQALAEARDAGRTHIFIAMHHPPYSFFESDQTDFEALPPADRYKFLDLARAYGVTAILAGHRHLNLNYPGKTTPLYILAGSAYNLDVVNNTGIGYNLFRVTSAGASQVYVRLDAPADTVPPQAPWPLEQVARTSASLTLAWPRPADNVGTLRYAILRDGAPYAISVEEVFVDTGLAPGETHSYAVKALDPAGNASAPSNTLTASSGIAGVKEYVIPGSAWRVLDGGRLPGTDWMQPYYDDSTWRLGLAQLGYGDGDESTTVSLGSDPLQKPLTAWFRFTFNIPTYAVMQILPTFKVLCDDGAVVYLNGGEIGRWNMPEGRITPSTPALREVEGAEENTWREFPLPWPMLRYGLNTLAVEVHQAGPASPDLSFDLTLADTTLLDPVALTRGPYLQDVGTTAVTVRWRTDVPAPGRVSFGTSLDAMNQTMTDLTPATEHELRLTGLQPDTAYAYRIEAGYQVLAGGDAATFFRTAPPAGIERSTRIWVLGDSGTGSEGPGPAANARAVRDGFQRFTGSRVPDLMLMLGDNARPSGTDEQHQLAVFDMFAAFLRAVPLWSTLGNHDAYSTLPGTSVHPYYQIFTFPTAGESGGIPSGSEAYYSFDHGNIHFICLDSTEEDRSTSGSMLSWLQRDLAANRAPWTIAFFHSPPYSKGAHDSDLAGNADQTAMRQNALPLLEAGGVDLVLSGHSHSYERSFLIDGHYGISSTLTSAMILDRGDGNPAGAGPYVKPAGRPSHAGTVYAVVGNSGLLTSGGSLNHPVMARSLLTLGSLVIDVRKARLEAFMIDVHGAVRDQFTIWKGRPSSARPRDWPQYR